MKFNKVLLGSAFAASVLYAIDPVSNLSISAPHNGGSKYNDANITFTWTPPSSVDSYIYIFDTNSSTVPSIAGNYSTINSNSATTWTHEVNASGDYYLHIQAVDSSNVKSSVVHTTSVVSIDIDKGTVTMTPDGGALTEKTTLTMNKSESGTIYYTTDGSTPTTSSSVYSSPLSIITGKTVKAILVDTAGNEGDVVEKVFTSSVQPTVVSTQDTTTADGATFATSDTILISTLTPNTSLTVGGGDSTEGFTRYKYKLSSDSAYTPSLTSDTNRTIATTIDISGLSSGSYTYYIIAGDDYSYKSESNKKSVTFTVDNDAPTSITASYDSNSTVTKVNPENKTNKTTIMSLSATDSSEIKYVIQNSAPTTYAGFTNTYSTPFELTNSVTDGSEGQVTVQIAARDASGNWGTSSKTYTIDKKDPTITMPATKEFATEFVTTMSFDDDGNTSTTDEGSIKYLIETTTGDCSTSKSVSQLLNTYDGTSVTITPQGTSDLCLYAAAIDEVENESTISSTKFTYDSNAIQINLDLLDNQTFATVSTHGATPVTDINVTLTEIGTNNFSYEFDSNGTEVNATSKNQLIDLTIFNSDEGEHNVTIRAYKTDLSDANVTEVRTFTVDNTPPSAYTSSDYTDGNFTTSTYDLKLENIGGDSVYYSSDNSSFTQAQADDQNSSKVKITLSSTTTLYTYKQDQAGNKSSTYSATLTQDIPTVTYTLSAGWNLVTLPTQSLSASGLSSAHVWDYNGTDWGNNISGDSYTDITAGNSSKGYWVYVASSTDIDRDGTDTSSSTISGASTGWSLLGTTSEITDTSDANITWVYQSGIWEYATASSDLNTTLNGLGYNIIDSIPANSGYWIYKE